MHEFHHANVSTDKLKVDTSYQRDASARKVNRIVNEFNMDLFNPPKVSHRKDGFYYIFDGQHSMLAHKGVFGDKTPINCKIYEGLTYDEEVDLFVAQNGICNTVATKDKLKAELTRSNSDAKQMVDAAQKVGITITFSPTGAPNQVCAVAAAYNIWHLLGKDDFINVLYVIKEAWGGESISYSAGILKGVAYIYKMFGQEIQNKPMINALRRHTPDWYIREAGDLRGNLMYRFAKLFIDSYNFKKTTHRLEINK